VNFFYTEQVERFAIGYVVNRFLYRILLFFRNWYAGSFLVISRQTVNLLESLDRTFGFRATLKHFFEPLYQDHTILGHLLGVLFRSFRLALAMAMYTAVIAVAAALYIGWALIPLYIASAGFL
jgi:hypothetical protein